MIVVLVEASRQRLSFTTQVSHRVFCSLHRTCPDNFPSWLGLEYHGLFGEGIGPLTLLRGRLLDDNEFCKAREKENACLFQLFVTDTRKSFEHLLDSLLRQFGLGCDFLNELRLRH